MNVERKEVMSMPVNEIYHFDQIPDYISKTNSELPIIVKNCDIYQCIELFDAVQQAKESGEAEIECLVIIPEVQSDSEVAILKAASRIKTLGGHATYPEIMKLILRLFEYLKSNCKDLKIYAHGGTRKGEAFKGNREDDAYTLISNRLGLKRSTVGTYLNYGNYLSDQILDDLAASEKPLIDKEFFEGFQSLKRQNIMDLKEDGKPEDEILKKISTLAREQLERLKGKKPGANKTELAEKKKATGSGNETDESSGNAEVGVSNQANNEAANSDEENPESDGNLDHSGQRSYHSLTQELKNSWPEVEKIINATDENSDLEPLQGPLSKHIELCRSLLTKARKQKKQQATAA